MDKIFTVEELVINDSFINYCNKVEPHDIAMWETYINEHPSELQRINEAKKMILGIIAMLELNREEILLRMENDIADDGLLSERGKRKKILFRSWAAAAAVFVIACLAFWLNPGSFSTKPLLFSDMSTVYETKPAEKRIIWLPDSTKVILNSGSVLHVDARFGENSRIVNIKGEAFFDVTFDAQKPFIVKTTAYTINVLGTAFNVKAYPDEVSSEATLLRGSIELFLNNQASQKILLKPDEKAVINTKIMLEHSSEDATNSPLKDNSVLIKKLTAIDNREGLIAETAWVNNRLELNDIKFSELKPVLERWYGVKVIIEDTEVGDYVFSATFEDESIDVVMEALRLSYPFHYSIKNNIIYISK